MPSQIYATAAFAYAYLTGLMQYARRWERGDADSSGSTLRTMGVVFLIVAVVLLIGAAVYSVAPVIVARINAPGYPW